ncbi:MAG: multicopper oxidase domain-containing protein [Crocinitomicaceae bacterium]
MDTEPQYQLLDGSHIQLMGFTEKLSTPLSLPSPTIRVTEGDTVEIELWNMSQAAPHTIHLHGLDVDQFNDGVPALSWVVEHDSKGYYNFIAPHPGTYLYHCHVISPIHVQAGMYGLFIVESKEVGKTWQDGYKYDKEIEWLTSELDIDWHTDSMINHSYNEIGHKNLIPDYEPEYFLLNGSALSLDSVNSIPIGSDSKTYLHLANIGNYINKISFPEQVKAELISSDGRPLPVIEITNEIFVFPGERFGVLISASDSSIENITIDYLDMNTFKSKGLLEQSFIFDETSQVKELSIIADLEIFPNPASDKLSISYKGELLLNYMIMDIQGRIINENILDFGLNQIEVDFLDSGVYILEINNGIKFFRQKLIIQKV